VLCTDSYSFLLFNSEQEHRSPISNTFSRWLKFTPKLKHGVSGRAQRVPSYHIAMSENVIQRQYQANKQEYDRIHERLQDVHDTVMNGDISEAKRIVHKSVVFAILTSRQSVEVSEEAYVKWYFTGDEKYAVRSSPCINKYENRIRKSVISLHGGADMKIIQAIRNSEYRQAAEIADNLCNGLGRIKGNFAIALMTGKCVCLDRWAARYVDEHTHVPDPDKSWSNNKLKERYYKAADIIEQRSPTGSAFVSQWIAFDYMRGIDNMNDKVVADGGLPEATTHDAVYQTF